MKTRDLKNLVAPHDKGLHKSDLYELIAAEPKCAKFFPVKRQLEKIKSNWILIVSSFSFSDKFR